MCIAVLEAMGCGAAVVATRIRAFEAMVVDGASGLLVPVGDPAALATAIGQAWDRRDTLGPAAADRAAQHFDTRRLYRQLAGRLRAAAGLPDVDAPPAGSTVARETVTA